MKCVTILIDQFLFFFFFFFFFLFLKSTFRLSATVFGRRVP